MYRFLYTFVHYEMGQLRVANTERDNSATQRWDKSAAERFPRCPNRDIVA